MSMVAPTLPASDRPASKAADGPVARRLDSSSLQSLEPVLDAVAAGQVCLINLDPLVEAFGARWQGRREGVYEHVEKVVERRPHTVRMMLTGYADITSIVRAINDGRIYRYIQKPWEPESLRIDVRRAPMRSGVVGTGAGVPLADWRASSTPSTYSRSSPSSWSCTAAR